MSDVVHSADYEKQQRFRRFNQKLLEPGSMWVMILGIAFLCQPWIEVLHQWSVTMMLVGLIGFNVAVHVPPPDRKPDVDDTGPIPAAPPAKGGPGHG